jgi:HEAT repeat protein
MRVLRNPLSAVALFAALLLAPSAFADADGLTDDLLAAWELDDGYVATVSSLASDPGIADADLAALAEHPDWRVRTQAAIVLGRRLAPELTEAVWSARPIRDRGDVRVRFMDDALKLDGAASVIVERILHGNESPLVRSGLAGALVSRAADWGDHLVGLLGEVDEPSVREAIAWGFRHTTPEVAEQGLRLCMADADAGVRAEAARTVGWRADGASLAADLIALLDDEAATPRAMAARALGWLAVAEAAPQLASLVDDVDAQVRLHALRSLDRVEPEAARRLPQLDALTRDADRKVARVARRIAADR